MKLKFITLLIFTLLSIWPVNAQESFFTQQKTDLLGLKQLHSGEILLILSSSNTSIAIQMVDPKGEKSWNSIVSLGERGVYDFNRLQVHCSNEHIYLINQVDASAHLWILHIGSGQILTDKAKIPLKLDADSEGIQAYATDSSLVIVKREKNQLLYCENQSGQFSEFKVHTKIEDKFNAIYLHSNFINTGQIFSSSYTLSKNHEKMHLYLEKRLPGAEEAYTTEIDFELDNMSFTYNSIFDNGVMAITKGSDGFYLYGKLDMKFNGTYPSKRTSEGFIGFWLAKIDFDLRLLYFHQYPFQNLNGLVSQNAISKPAVLDIKEDINGGLFLVVNEIQQITYGEKYLLYFDDKGELKVSIGGKDVYNFFDYDRMGLRPAGRSTRTRLMNDDWSPYTSSSLHTMNYVQQHHSAVIGNIMYLSAKENGLEEKIVFTYLYRNNQLYIFKYTRKKKGTLEIYTFTN
jgi:hypothetical protein